MALSRLRSVLKRNPSMHRLGVWGKSRLPKRCFYSRDYFQILSLNRKYEQPGQQTAVRTMLKGQLAVYLKEALEHVPYYMETVKVRPAAIDESNAEDVLKEFPYLHKSTIMDNREAFLSRKADSTSLKYNTSGGSTGRGIGIWRTKEELDIETAFVIHEWGKLGLDWERSKIVRIGAEGNKRDDEDPFFYYANRLSVSSFHLNDRWMEEIYRSIVAFRPQFIWAYPSCVEALARYMEHESKPRMKLKGILMSSESFLRHQYAVFKRAFDSPISDLYGLTERTNMAFLREPEGGGELCYRLVDTYGYSENRRDEYGNDEIVGTSYWNFAMPLIRYRTQDIGTIDENGVIRNLRGRIQDFIVDRKGRRIPSLSFNIEKWTWDYVKIYQIAQEKAGELIVRFVPRENFTDAIEKSILDYMKRGYDEFFDIRIELVSEITPTAAGKRLFFLNRRPQ